MTIATVSSAGAYCANLFYSYMADENMFVFTTDLATRHGAEMATDDRVAASIVLETRTVGKIQGLQICGTVRQPTGDELKKAKKAYVGKYPYSALAELTLWVLSPDSMKLTDNRLGFGKKLYWSKE